VANDAADFDKRRVGITQQSKTFPDQQFVALNNENWSYVCTNLSMTLHSALAAAVAGTCLQFANGVI
jgi:hypothetical protein